MALLQTATLANGSTVLAETWETGWIGAVKTADVPLIYADVTHEVNEFVDDFHSQNPSSSTPS